MIRSESTSLSRIRDDLLPGMARKLVSHSKLEGDISIEFDYDDFTFRVYNSETKKLAKRTVTREDIADGEFPSIVDSLIKEALGEG